MWDGMETKTLCRPCLVLAHPMPEYQTLLAHEFRRRGWDVYLAHSGPEARHLIRMLNADVAILHADLREESGWLTCDKLTREQPLARVILVSEKTSRRSQELAVFVGASALVDCTEGLTTLIEELIGSPTPVAG